MTITAKKISFIEQQPTSEGYPIADNALGLVGEMTVECLVRLGTVTMTINELRQLKQGSQLTLNQKTHEPIDIVLNNQVIARGELMCCEDCFAIQITTISTGAARESI